MGTKQLGITKDLFKLNPLGTSKDIIKNEAILAVLASSILSPMLVPTIQSYVAKLPYVSTHVTIAAAIPAILLFRIGVSMQNRVLGALVLGVAGSFVLASVLPFISPVLNKVSN